MALKPLLALLLYCLSGKQGLCGSKGGLTISNTDTVAHILSSKVLLVGKRYLDRNLLVSMFIPLEEDDSLMFELMVETNQKMNSFWTLLTNDSALPKSKYGVINPTAGLNIPDVYIIPLHQQDEFGRLQAQLEQLNQYENFNKRAVFVFIKLTNVCGQYNKTNIWLPYFSYLWKNDFLITVILVLSKCDFQLTIVKAEPFSLENPCRSANIHGIHFHTFSPEIEVSNLMKRSPKYFNGCKFVGAAANYPPYTYAKPIQKLDGTIVGNYTDGLEIELLRILSTKLGFTYKIYQSYDYSMMGCEKANEQEINREPRHKQKKIDFCFGGMTPNHRTILRYDISFTYKVSTLTLFVADAGVVPQWKMVFNTSSSEVWILMVLANLTLSLIYNKLEEYEYNGSEPTNKRTCKKKKNFLEQYRTFLGLPSTLKPQTLHLQVLYVTWTLFSLHITIAFSTVLFEHLRNPPFEKEITTIQDFLDSGLNIAGPDGYFAIFQDFANTDTTLSFVLNQKVTYPNLEKSVEDLVMYKNLSIMDRHEHIRLLVDFEKYNIHKIRENMISFGVNTFLSKGSPLTMELNNVAMYAFETGLIRYWQKKAGWSHNYQLTLDIPAIEYKYPITVKALITAVYFLNTGHIVAFLVFIIEISYNYLNKKIIKRV